MTEKKAPRKEDGLDLFVHAIATGDGGDAIRGQEAAGQQSFVGSDTLPTDIRSDAKQALEAVGVQFLGVVEDDPMFQYVVLPDGWKKAATGHSMHSDLIDEKGRKRASIFYKAAFYDRSAHMSVSRRFGVSLDYDKIDKGIAEVAVIDCGNEVFHSKSISFDKNAGYQEEEDARSEAFDDAKNWLNQNYPEWENAAAYWE